MVRALMRSSELGEEEGEEDDEKVDEEEQCVGGLWKKSSPSRLSGGRRVWRLFVVLPPAPTA